MKTTIREILTMIDNVKSNIVQIEDKIRWISQLDERVSKEVIEHYEPIEFYGYESDVDLDTELLVETPYTDMYIYWLEAKIDFDQGEITDYNNEMIMFNDEYKEYANNYNNTHMPLQDGRFIL